MTITFIFLLFYKWSPDFWSRYPVAPSTMLTLTTGWQTKKSISINMIVRLATTGTEMFS